MLTTELSASVERTLIAIAAFIWTGVIFVHFGMTTESVTICLPTVTAVMAYWFAGTANIQPKPPEPPPPTIIYRDLTAKDAPPQIPMEEKK